MALKERNDYRLKETEKLYDALKRTTTNVKDYSLAYTITIIWKADDEQSRNRLVKLSIGDESWVGTSYDIARAVNGMASDADKNGWFPRGTCVIPGEVGTLYIETTRVNDECLRDHMARLFISNNTSVVDLEELMKATRYA